MFSICHFSLFNLCFRSGEWIISGVFWRRTKYLSYHWLFTLQNRMIELYVSTFLVVDFQSVKKLPCKDVCFSHSMLCSVFTSFNAFENFVNLKVFVLYICLLFIKYTRFYKSWMWGYFCCFFLVWFKCHFMQKQWSWFYECKSSMLIIIHKLQK